MDASAWREPVEVLKSLLRLPVAASSATSDSAQSDDQSAASAIAAARGQRVNEIGELSGALAQLVFESCRNWFEQDADWVIRNLHQFMHADQEAALLPLFADPSELNLVAAVDLLAGYIVQWRQAAEEQAAAAPAPETAGDLVGEPNTVNWNASRTPGTYYYTYVDGRYLYSDLREAPMSEWETLPVREKLATDNAAAWGSDGWYYTPTGEPGLYGGAHVFAADREGPWMTEEQARAAMSGHDPASAGTTLATDEPQSADERTDRLGVLWDYRLRQAIERVRKAGTGPDQLTDEQIAAAFDEALAKAMKA